MRWDDFRRSDDIEDRRGEEGGGGGGGFGFPIGGGGIGIGTVLVLGLIGWATGIDPGMLINIVAGGGGYEQPYDEPRSAPSQQTEAQRQDRDFVAAIKGEIDDRWKEIFTADNQRYRPAGVVLFSGQTYHQGDACGAAQDAMGPFYCPPNQKIYLDTNFFQEVERRFRGCSGPACKFTQAYIIAHEAGHHIQNLLGILPKAQQAQRAAGNKAEANRIQVRVELQADCFAGVWANQENQKRNFLDPGDVDAALQTAAAIGDDTLQRKAQGRVVPDAFTHGSAEQRKRWFMTGFTQGKVAACNTFGAGQP
jgi:predicted metalloprotease